MLIQIDSYNPMGSLVDRVEKKSHRRTFEYQCIKKMENWKGQYTNFE